MKHRLMTFLLSAIGAVTFAAPALSGYAASSPHEHAWLHILRQPESQIVTNGSPFTFSVQVEGHPPNESRSFAYQWQVNMNFSLDDTDQGWADIPSATSDTYSNSHATAAGVGWYRVSVTDTNKHKPPFFSDPASLAIYSDVDKGTLLTLLGPPVVSAHTQSSCPGDYTAYVNYKQPLPGWGWQPTNTHGSFAAQDGTANTNTKVEMSGASGDHPCSPTPVVQTNQLPSAKYRFTIYFTSPPGTNSYPITLTGFR